jgi:hypothetical protein
MRDRGGCQQVLKGSSSTFQQPPPTTAYHRRRYAAAAVVVRPSRRRVLKALQVLPLQALHLAYEASPSATYDVSAWSSGRPFRVVVSSAAGLIITVTDGGGEDIERETGCATGLRMMVVDHSRVRLRCPQASMVLI